MAKASEQKQESEEPATTGTHRHVGLHPDTLANGRSVGPGEFVDLTAEEIEDPHNAALIEAGVLLDTAAAEEGGSA